jgi:hypothetical protein
MDRSPALRKGGESRVELILAANVISQTNKLTGLGYTFCFKCISFIRNLTIIIFSCNKRDLGKTKNQTKMQSQIYPQSHSSARDFVSGK